MGILLQPGGGAVGVDGQQDQITPGNGGLVQPAVDCACQHGELQHILVALGGIDGVAGHGICPGQTAADETQA